VRKIYNTGTLIVKIHIFEGEECIIVTGKVDCLISAYFIPTEVRENIISLVLSSMNYWLSNIGVHNTY